MSNYTFLIRLTVLEGLTLTKTKRIKGPIRNAKDGWSSWWKKQPMKSKRWMGIGAIVVVVVAVGVAVELPLLLGGTGPYTLGSSAAYGAATQGHAPYPLVEADADGMIQLPLDTFDDYAAHYYTFLQDDQSIEFFVLKSTDGTVRSAFNACDVCYGSLKGYRQEGQVMICNNCGNTFPADQINIVRGGCNPSPLNRVVKDAYLVIDAADIALGLSYF